MPEDPVLVLSASEHREIREATRKTLLKNRKDLEKRRACIDITEEHVRMTAKLDALFLATFWKELVDQKVPEDLVRAIFVKTAREQQEHRHPVDIETEEEVYTEGDGPVGNEHA